MVSASSSLERPSALHTIRLFKRNMELVTFDPAKIAEPVRRALERNDQDPALAGIVSDRVARRLLEENANYYHLEALPEVLSQELMRLAVERQRSEPFWFKVVESYIVDRNEQAGTLETERAEDEFAGFQDSHVTVIASDKSSSMWLGEDLRARIRFSLAGLAVDLSANEVERELRRSIFDGITADQLKSTLILNAKSLLLLDPAFGRFAARFFASYVYEEVLGWDILRDGPGALKEFHRRHFRRHLERLIEIERLVPAMVEFDVAALAAALDPTADYDFEFSGLSTLYDRYLLVDKSGPANRRLETFQYFWMRVAMGHNLRETSENRTARVLELYELYRRRLFCSSTPTLFNAGTPKSQLSSCFVYTVPDSIEGIFQRGIADNAYLAKWAGGLGGSWTQVRGTGAHIAGTNGESQGVVPFLKLHSDQLVAVSQAGKRKGSGCAYLETWHNDILEFLELRRNAGDDRRRTHDLNTANWIPDLFMKRVEARRGWTLFRSNDVSDLHDLYGRKFEERYEHYESLVRAGKLFGQPVEALDLWKKMLSMLFETGHPWITFKDPSNIRSPQDHAGVIHSSNLCSEVLLNTSAEETAVCNLGSVVLDQHICPDGSLDLLKLRDTIRRAVRALDNVIDLNFYPTEAARLANLRHRPIGLGVMGLHYALLRKGLAFASEEAVEFNDEAMEAVAFFAFEASSDLAAERGRYGSYAGSKWDRGLLPQDTIDILEKERGVTIDVPRGGRMDWTALRAKIARQGMRNSNVLAIAPTATISNIVGSSPCIEPLYKNFFVKSNLGGEFVITNPFLVEDLKRIGEWDDGMRKALLGNDGELEPAEGCPHEIESRLRMLPSALKEKYRTAFGIEWRWILDAAARRQKWVDQSQSLNLWIKTPDLKELSHMYRRAWHVGLKTTYYLRAMGASAIEKATLDVKKEVRGAAGAAELPDPEQASLAAACSIRAAGTGTSCSACE